MDLNTGAFVVGFRSQDSEGALTVRQWADQLLVLQGSGSGVPPVRSTLQLAEEQWSNFIGYTGANFGPITSQAGLGLRILEFGTAALFLVVSDRNARVLDARARLLSEWLPEKADLRSNVELRVRRLVSIKSAFGLSNSDLARVCQISRTQLYKWVSSDTTIQLASANWQRLADLAEFADQWNQLSARPARDLLNEKLHDGTTLLSLLTAPHLDHGAIRKAMAGLARIISRWPIGREGKLRQAGIEPRPLVGQIARDE